MRNTPAIELWQAVLGEVELQVPRPAYETFLKETRALSLEGEVLTITVPTPFAAEWLERRAYHLIQRTAQRLAARHLELHFQVAGAPSSEATEGEGHQPSGGALPLFLNHRYTFGSFVVGPSNELAFNASWAVAQKPGAQYNPLFIYAGVGLGKTHLLQAIGHEVQRRRQRCLYVTSEHFTNDFISSLREGTTPQFRHEYRSPDVLLMDDIQFVAGKQQTQEVLFHTFNDLHNTNRQIVIASDRPPRALSTLQDRLCSRFQWGLTVEIRPPSLETCVAIIQARSSPLGIRLEDALAEYLAHTAGGTVRELEGALNRLCAYCSFTGAPPTLDTAQRAFADLSAEESRPSISAERILAAVAGHFGLPVEALLSPARDRNTAFARQVAMYLLHKEMHLSLSEIGRTAGGRDHSTVNHALRKISRSLLTDASLPGVLVTIRRHLSAPSPYPHPQ